MHDDPASAPIATTTTPGAPGLGRRPHCRCRNLFCIALSAGAMPEQMAQALAAGFDDYWTRPLDVHTAAERIELALAEAEGRRTATTGVL